MRCIASRSTLRVLVCAVLISRSTYRPLALCGIDQSLHLQALGAHAVYCELLQLRVLKLMRLTRFSVLRALDFLQFTATCRRNIV